MTTTELILAVLAQGVDVSDRLERFESPIPKLYGEGWDKVVKVGKDAVAYSGKQVTYDLQLYRGRIYVGHGSTNSKRKTFMLYFDPKTGAYDVDRDASGRPLEFPEECMARMRVFDDELYVTSTDQLDGGTKFFRKNRDGSWTIRTAHKEQQHSRDLYKTGPHLFIHFGFSSPSFSGETYPGVLYSPDDGRSWRLPAQPELYDGPYLGYTTFFGFKEVCYATRQASPWVPAGKGEYVEGRTPWLVAFSGDAAKPFRVVCRTPADFHPELSHGEPPKPGRDSVFDGPSPAHLHGGITVAGKLILANRGEQLFAVESMEPVKARLAAVTGLELGGPEGWRVTDMLERPSAGYLLLLRHSSSGEGEAKRWTRHVVVARSADAETWTPILTFSSPHNPRALEELDGDFYFGLFKSELLRVRGAAYAR